MIAQDRNRPTSRRRSVSTFLPKNLALRIDSKIVIASPVATADTKNNTGSHGEYQRTWSLCGTIRKSVPSEL